MAKNQRILWTIIQKQEASAIEKGPLVFSQMNAYPVATCSHTAFNYCAANGNIGHITSSAFSAACYILFVNITQNLNALIDRFNGYISFVGEFLKRVHERFRSYDDRRLVHRDGCARIHCGIPLFILFTE